MKKFLLGLVLGSILSFPLYLSTKDFTISWFAQEVSTGNKWSHWALVHYGVKIYKNGSEQ